MKSSEEVTYTEKIGVNIITNSETFCRKRTGAGRVRRAGGGTYHLDMRVWGESGREPGLKSGS